MIPDDLWSIAICPQGFVVFHNRHRTVKTPLRQRWHWANHPEGDPRRRPHVGTWVCGSRPLIFTDYRKAQRTVKRLNACYNAFATAARLRRLEQHHK